MSNDGKSKQLTIVMTGGGTAGHVTPNMALIPHLQELGFTDIHYIGTNKIEKDMISNLPNVTYHQIPAGKLRRYFSLENITDAFKVVFGIIKAKSILKKISPDIVFSKGGYVAVPVVIGAKNIAPVVAHESDYTPGLATRLSVKSSAKICVSFENTLKNLPEDKAVYTGSPIRDSLFLGDAQRGKRFLDFSQENNKPILLVMGGSLGAEAVNQVVRDALPKLLQVFNIVHICGKDKIDESYTEFVGYKQFEFVSDELPDIFAATDIAISRSGANSVFEFLALCKPSLLIPLPSKTSRGDQYLNAMCFTNNGYSEMIDQDDLTTDILVDSIVSLYENRDKYIEAMSANTHAKDGTQNVLKVIMSQINKD